MTNQFFRCLPDESTRTPINKIALAPRVQFSEYSGFYRIAVGLERLSQGDIDIRLDRDMLTIIGERKMEASEDRDDPDLADCKSIRYNIGLPDDIDEDKVTALFSDDRLVVTVGRRVFGSSFVAQAAKDD